MKLSCSCCFCLKGEKRYETILYSGIRNRRHPDKLSDLIADSILDECLKGDPEARVACEVLATKGTVLLAGEITSKYEPDVLAVAEDVVEKVGYQAGEILFDALIHQQSPDIAQGVQNSMESRKQHAAGEEWKMGAGDQGVMTGYACSETKQFLPLPVVLAHRIVRELSACRISEYIQGLLPDGKAQVTVEYEDGKPVRLDTVIVSCQHVEEKSKKRSGTGDSTESVAPGTADASTR